MLTNALRAFRAACRSAFDGIKPFAVPFQIPLPGSDWEPFEYCEGGPVRWRSVPCEFGRMVEFAAEGEARMARHHHDSSEVLHVRSGRLIMEQDAQTFQLEPGESLTIPQGRLHAAHYLQPGSCICWWPDQKTDVLEIGVV